MAFAMGFSPDAQRNSSKSIGCISSWRTPEGNGSRRFSVVTPRRLPLAMTRHGESAKNRREFNAFSDSCTSSKKSSACSGSRARRLYSAILDVMRLRSSVGPSKIRSMVSRSVWKSSSTNSFPTSSWPTCSIALVFPVRRAPRISSGCVSPRINQERTVPSIFLSM